MVAKKAYVCCRCGLGERKLWRQMHDAWDFECANCIGASPDSDGMAWHTVFMYRRDQLKGGWLPAVLTADFTTVFGYGSIPPDRYEWWRALPSK
jgi:hypothetical protein